LSEDFETTENWAVFPLKIGRIRAGKSKQQAFKGACWTPRGLPVRGNDGDPGGGRGLPRPDATVSTPDAVMLPF